VDEIEDADGSRYTDLLDLTRDLRGE
jgi:hypothetical protein